MTMSREERSLRIQMGRMRARLARYDEVADAFLDDWEAMTPDERVNTHLLADFVQLDEIRNPRKEDRRI